MDNRILKVCKQLVEEQEKVIKLAEDAIVRL